MTAPGAPSPEAQARLERFSKGDRFAVNPDAIERELAALWREAGESTASHQPVTRACLWNVVFHAEGRPGRPGHEEEGRLGEIVRELPRYLASRALVLRTYPAEPGKAELESWISANCALAADGSKVVCSEEITIAAYGHGDVHLPSLVRALLVPDVPTAIVFAGVPGEPDVLIEGLLDAGDRMIVRTDASREPGALERAQSIARSAPLGVMDLDWIAQASLRTLIAELFEPPVDDRTWQSVEEITVACEPGSESSARLLLGWITVGLGGISPELIVPGTWNVPVKERGPLTIHLVRLADPAKTVLGIGAVTFVARGRTFGVRMLDERCVSVEPDGTPPRPALIDPPTDAALLASALRSRSEDRALLRALAFASRM